MDANWRGSTVAGVDFAKPTAEQRAAVAEAFGAADAANLIGVSSKNVYLIKWISPYRKVGMKLIFR